MTDKEVDRLIEGRVLDPKLLSPLAAQKNDYGDFRLHPLTKQIPHGREIAESFGFDPVIVTAILVLSTLARPAYGEVGDAFLRRMDPDYNRQLYAKRLSTKVLCGIDSEKTALIIDGAARAIVGKHQSAEEKIVEMLYSGLAFADSLENRGAASLFLSGYKRLIIKKTAAAGRLTDHIIPENDLPLRPKLQPSDEVLAARSAALEESLAHYRSHPEEVPAWFREGWGDLPEEIILSYYAVRQSETL